MKRDSPWNLCYLTQMIQLRMVGERGFEPPTPWSRTWGRGADFVVIQSFEWCFNRIILAQSRHSGMNVSPRMAVPHGAAATGQGPVQRQLIDIQPHRQPALAL